jgi:ATP synthase protein I
MALFIIPPADPGRKKKDRTYAQIALLGTVPAIMVAAPAVGFFAGRWVDGRFHTAPYLTILGVILGFVAAGKEIYNLVRRAQELDKDSDSD